MKRKSRIIIPILAFVLIAAGCTKDDAKKNQNDQTKEDGFTELVPEKPDYVKADLSYYGSGGFETSDYWGLNLYTDMDQNASGEWTGPGQMIRLAFNAKYDETQSADISFIIGEYTRPNNDGDYSAGTYMQGYMNETEIPGGTIQSPAGTYFGNLASGSTEIEADLLREGEFSITDNGDGTFTVEGILVGTDYLKRYFSYTGELTVKDNAGGNPGVEVPNSNLEANVDLSAISFTKANLADNGDYFFLGDESYRIFVLYIAEEGIELPGVAERPTGKGKLMRIEFSVPYATTVEDGIPAGKYTIMKRTGSGVAREDVVPFRIVEGKPDSFENNTGTWYQEIDGTQWIEYARITDGSVTVERDGTAHKLTIDLKDCSDPAWTLSGTWQTAGPIPAAN